MVRNVEVRVRESCWDSRECVQGPERLSYKSTSGVEMLNFSPPVYTTRIVYLPPLSFLSACFGVDFLPVCLHSLISPKIFWKRSTGAHRAFLSRCFTRVTFDKFKAQSTRKHPLLTSSPAHWRRRRPGSRSPSGTIEAAFLDRSEWKSEAAGVARSERADPALVGSSASCSNHFGRYPTRLV